MSDNRNWNNLGEQFRTTVQDAINSGDFQGLNRLVTDTVTDAVSEVGRQVKNVAGEIQKDIKKQNGTRRSASQNAAPRKRVLPITKTKSVGQVSSILYMIFGGIGTGAISIVLFAGLICLLFDLVWSGSVFAILLLLLAVFVFMIRKGLRGRKRLKRMKRYVSLCDDNLYVNIKELAEQTNKSPQYVLKDVKKMLELGFFPEGHLDEEETCLMLDDSVYREYLKVERERKLLEQEEAAREKQQAMKQSDPANKELQTMIQEGQDYIQKLHYMNDLIEDEVVSEKLYRMENLLIEIFERVEEEPAQMPKMHKLMNYYLPTTLKLLQAYDEFDNVSSPGKDIVSAKVEIEKTVDTINEAFAELLNKLFQSAVFDVTTDARVLQTMLAKEGLTKNDFGG